MEKLKMDYEPKTFVFWGGVASHQDCFSFWHFLCFFGHLDLFLLRWFQFFSFYKKEKRKFCAFLSIKNRRKDKKDAFFVCFYVFGTLLLSLKRFLSTNKTKMSVLHSLVFSWDFYMFWSFWIPTIF